MSGIAFARRFLRLCVCPHRHQRSARHRLLGRSKGGKFWSCRLQCAWQTGFRLRCQIQCRGTSLPSIQSRHRKSRWTSAGRRVVRTLRPFWSDGPETSSCSCRSHSPSSSNMPPCALHRSQWTHVRRRCKACPSTRLHCCCRRSLRRLSWRCAKW